MPNLLADRQITVPYITAWSDENDPPVDLVAHPSREIAYLDESLADRDGNGVLWLRTSFNPQQGKPNFGKIHPLRQRQTMRRLLCQVCASPADSSDDGVLWLLQDHREDWPTWPEGMGVTEPPVCLPCVRTSVRLCPALRRSAVAIRVRHCPMVGIHGTRYGGSPVPTAIENITVKFDDPDIRWMQAANLVRELRDCTIVPLAESAGL